MAGSSRSERFSRPRRPYLARHEFDRRRSRLRRQHAVEDISSVAPVFGPIGSVDGAVDIVVGVNEGGVLLEASGPDPTLVRLLDATKPGTVRPCNGADVEAIAVADRPDRYCLAQRAVAPAGRDLYLFSRSD